MKKFAKFGCLGIIAIVVLVIAIGAIGSGDESANDSGAKKVETSGSEETAKGKASEEAKKEEGPTTFAVGDTVDLDGLEVTIASAQYVSPNQYTKPEKGKVLQMQVEVTNNTDDKVFFDSTEFNMYDPEGNALDEYYGLDTMDISGEVHPGKKLSGPITYDVPEAETFELIYEPMFSWTEKQIVWEVKPQ